jgi:hypothetical protein
MMNNHTDMKSGDSFYFMETLPLQAGSWIRYKSTITRSMFLLTLIQGSMKNLLRLVLARFYDNGLTTLTFGLAHFPGPIFGLYTTFRGINVQTYSKWSMPSHIFQKRF